MNYSSNKILVFFLCLTYFGAIAQNETNKWYFGNKAGLDFVTDPPTLLTNGALSFGEGAATISDAAGNLLFYTYGDTIWNKNHVPMANGIGLAGNYSSSQSAIILKLPGSASLYYVFTQSGPYYNNSPLGYPGTGLAYSIVDMNLAAGMGSVTVKNFTLAANCSEKLTYAKHCNGEDYWVITHGWNSADFMSYRLTATGINTTAVVSTVGSVYASPTISVTPIAYAGYMRVSPNGKKLAAAITPFFDMSSVKSGLELFDFNNTTGVVSNSLSLISLQPPALFPYGCEFSPDGTKLYATCPNFSFNYGSLWQWNLCAGNNNAILASAVTITTEPAGLGCIQKASNGKIYIAKAAKSFLGVINNPNDAGMACNYNSFGQSIAPRICSDALANFFTSTIDQPTAISYTPNCSEAQFICPLALSVLTCPNAAYTNSLSWNFGDPASGATNTSTLTNPTHTFSAGGTYTTQLIVHHDCGLTDTVSQTVLITNPGPPVFLNGPFDICAGETHSYTVWGADAFYWLLLGNFTPTIYLSPVTTSTYAVSGANTLTGCVTTKVFTITINKCLSIDLHIDSKDFFLTVYPNPTNGNFYIECDQAFKIELSDPLGRTVLSAAYEPGKQLINIDDLENEIYFLKLITNDYTGTKRLVKMSD